MTDEDYARALATERAGYVRAGRHDRVIPVDEQLALLGWCVTVAGELVRLPADRGVKPVEQQKRPVRERRPQVAPERVVED